MSLCTPPTTRDADDGGTWAIWNHSDGTYTAVHYVIGSTDGDLLGEGRTPDDAIAAAVPRNVPWGWGRAPRAADGQKSVSGEA